jgi:shikimate kinase
MGCGKTTAGKKLANKMGWPFIDLDLLIEEHTGKSIAEIFEKEGEPAFRELEKQVLHSTFLLKHAIISTGGGAPCFFDNIDQMNLNGKTVYIELPSAVLADRLKAAKNQRPLIKGKSDEELLVFISEGLEKRAPYYQKAKFIVDGINLSAESILMVLNVEHQ